MPALIPARILRADVIAREPALNDRNQREQQQYDRILTHAPPLFATYGRNAISFTRLAIALKMAPGTLRKHFADLDALLAHILITHLLAISAAIGQAAHAGENRHKAARAAYLRATRGPFGGLTEAHALFVAECRNLPPDLRGEVETLHRDLGEICAGPLAEKALTLLDAPCYSATDIEHMLAGLGASGQAPAVKPRNDDMARFSSVTVPLGARQERSKVFFSEEKKQKTFAHGAAQG